MKKIVLVLLCAAISVAASAETESFCSFGFQYGNYWEKVTKSKGSTITSIGSPGLVLNEYVFFNKKNIGLFASESLLFPSNSSLTVNGITVKDGVKDSNFSFLFQFGIGPAFKYAITNKLNILLGAGFNISMLSTNAYRIITSNRVGANLSSLNLGIIGDIGLSYNITDIVYFDVGTKLVLDFANYTKISSAVSAYNASQRNSNYIGFHLSPYIGLGFKLPYNPTIPDDYVQNNIIIVKNTANLNKENFIYLTTYYYNKTSAYTYDDVLKIIANQAAKDGYYDVIMVPKLIHFEYIQGKTSSQKPQYNQGKAGVFDAFEAAGEAISAVVNSIDTYYYMIECYIFKKKPIVEALPY